MFEMFVRDLRRASSVSVGRRWAWQQRTGRGSATAPVVCIRKAMRTRPTVELVDSSEIGSAIAKQYKLSPQRRGKPFVGRSTLATSIDERERAREGATRRVVRYTTARERRTVHKW